ncbi:MAG: AAA family ATPase [Candidatus Helarchaeota archaeon]
MAINSLTIRNFRCISELKIDKVTPITIFVGRNNTGKSALLEAIALAVSGGTAWFDSLGNDLIESIVEKRGGWEYVDLMIKLGETSADISAIGENFKGYLQITKEIENIRDKNSSTAFSKINDYIEKLLLKLKNRLNEYFQDFPEKQEDMLIDIINNAIQWLDENIWHEFKTFIYFYEEMTDKSEIALIGKTGKLNDFLKNTLSEIKDLLRNRHFIIKPFNFKIENLIRSSLPRKGSILFLSNPTIQFFKKLQRQLTKEGDLIDFIKVIKKRINYFEDIREIDKKFFVFIKGLKNPIPLEAMGDGFYAQLTILSAIATVKNGIILMEEPENKLHPGYMSLIANQIIETAVQGDLQYFISTHSIEFIQFLLEANPELVKIVRMYMIEDESEIDYEILDGREALEEFKELKMDLRGI